MGKNTWDSIDSQKREPLPKRDKIIMSRNNLDITTANTQSIKNISDLYAICNEKKYDDIFVIGGEQIYSMFLEEIWWIQFLLQRFKMIMNVIHFFRD